MTDGELLYKKIEQHYGLSLDAEETNYYNGQYYYWNEMKDYKPIKLS